MKVRRLFLLNVAVLAPLLAVVACNSPSPPTITSFTASPASLSAPGSVTLAWNAVNASSLSISPGVGAVTGNSKAVNVTASTTFTLMASNASGSVTATASVTVSPTPPPGAPVIVSFTATPASLPAGGGSTTLAWNVTGASSLSIDDGVGDVTGLTSKVLNVSSTRTFQLTATNAQGSTIATVDVTVGVSSLQPGVWDQSHWNEATWQ